MLLPWANTHFIKGKTIFTKCPLPPESLARKGESMKPQVLNTLQFTKSF